MVNIIIKSVFLMVFLFGAFFISLLVHEGIHYQQYKELDGKSICYNFASHSWTDFRGTTENEELYSGFTEEIDFNEKIALIVQLIFVLSLVFIGGYFIGKWKKD